MKLREHLNANSFVDAALPFLMKDEALNNLPIGVALSSKNESTNAPSGGTFLTVEDDGETVAIGLITPPYLLLIQAKEGADEAAFPLLVDHFRFSPMRLPGIIGLKPLAKRFAELWCEKTEQQAEVWRNLRVFRLDQVTPMQQAPGHLRPIQADDTALILKWIIAFYQEIGESKSPAEAQRFVDKLLEERNLFLWIDENKTPVSCACNLRKIVAGSVINLVYTPPEQRGKGFASACVATLSQMLLDSGTRFCCLFTDLQNPTSNSIYQKIGYIPIGDYQAIRFQSRQSK